MLPNEEPDTCAAREILEETRLTVKRMEEAGVLYFYNNSQRLSPISAGHVFLTDQFDGVPIDGREGRLEWFSVDALPFDEMWEDDQYWYGLASRG